MADQGILHTLVATAITQPGAQGIFRRLADDIDHRHKGVGAVSGRTRATGNFDTLNIFQGDGNIIPDYLRNSGFIDRATIHLYLQPTHKVLHGGMVNHGIGVFPLTVAHHHTGHKPQQLRDTTGTPAADLLRFNHRHTGRHFGPRLLQAGSGQYHRDFVVLNQKVIRHILSPDSTCHQGQGKSQYTTAHDHRVL